MFGELWRRFEFVLRRKRFEEDLAEEMRLHLDLRAIDEGGGHPRACVSAMNRSYAKRAGKHGAGLR